MAEVKLSQESYDELLADITTLRAQADVYFEKWKDAKRKAEAFDEILDINIDKDELLSEEYIEKVNDVIQEWIFS